MKEVGVKYGLMYGVASIGLSYLCYLVNPDYLFSFSFPLIVNGLLCIPFMFIAIKSTQTIAKMNFGSSLRPAFLTYIIGAFLFSSFTWLLIHYLDNSLIDLQFEAMKNRAAWMGEMMDKNQSEIDKMIVHMNSGPKTVGFSSVILQWLTGIIFPGIVVAIIVSLISKKI